MLLIFKQISFYYIELTLFYQLFCGFLFLLFIHPLVAQEVNVVLIGGQSNATGQGYVRNIPKSFQADTTVMFYYSKYLNQGEGGERW